MPAPLAAAPHPVDPAFPDLGGEHRAEPVTPEPHRLMADLDAAFRLACDAPVLFDFDGLTRRTDNLDELPLLPPSVVRDEAWWDLRRVYVSPDPLLCLLPKRFRGNAVYFTLARETLPRIARGEVKTPGWQQAHRQLEIRYPEEPRPKPVQRFTTHRNWPWR